MTSAPVEGTPPGENRQIRTAPCCAVDATDLFVVLCDSNRSRLLELLKSGEKTVSELTRSTRLRQPLVSHHLRILREAGLVEGRREGRFRLYKAVGGEVARQLARIEEAALALQAGAEARREGGAPPAGPGQDTSPRPARARRASKGP